MRNWTPEQRAAHGEKIRLALQQKNGNGAASGRVVVLTRPRVARATNNDARFATELEEAIEARELVRAIGWDLARKLAARMDRLTNE